MDWKDGVDGVGESSLWLCLGQSFLEVRFCFYLQFVPKMWPRFKYVDANILVKVESLEQRVLFVGRLRRTHIIAERPCLKMIDVALRDVETSVRNDHSVTSSIQTAS